MTVYFIQYRYTKLIKIGLVKGCGKDKMKSLETNCGERPISYILLGEEEGYRDREKQLHKKFIHLKEFGEWFRPEKDLLNYIRMYTIRSEENKLKAKQYVFDSTYPRRIEQLKIQIRQLKTHIEYLQNTITQLKKKLHYPQKGLEKRIDYLEQIIFLQTQLIREKNAGCLINAIK